MQDCEAWQPKAILHGTQPGCNWPMYGLTSRSAQSAGHCTGSAGCTEGINDMPVDYYLDRHCDNAQFWSNLGQCICKGLVHSA